MNPEAGTSDLVDPGSLANTVANVLDELFFSRKIPQAGRIAAARWIASRHGLPRAYWETFAPTDQDFSGALLFSGERLTSGAQVAHILGEEAMTALRLLDVKDRDVSRALAAADERLWNWICQSPHMPAKFCCATCSVAMWRCMLAGGFSDQEQVFAAGVSRLRKHRQDNGRWKSYPFYYTLLALAEMPGAIARTELKYAAPACERSMQRLKPDSAIGRRRLEIARRVLKRCS